MNEIILSIGLSYTILSGYTIYKTKNKLGDLLNSTSLIFIGVFWPLVWIGYFGGKIYGKKKFEEFQESQPNMLDLSEFNQKDE